MGASECSEAQMRILKLALPAAILTTILFTGKTTDISWAEAQASTPVTDVIAARDTATPREDIMLTNSCIEDGMEKIYCLCVTKIFKNEMTLREYRGAVSLYQQQDSNAGLTEQGYSAAELSAINTLSQKLSSESKFRTRCDEAETYFAATTEG